MPPTAKTLNLVGVGRVARTLGKLWHDAEVFVVHDVMARAREHAQDAAAFIGAGRVVAALRDMHAADVWLIATPDDAIASCAAALQASGLLRGNDVVFHCSGALPSTLLPGMHRASVHPLKSFANPADAAHSFSGTWCAAEGDAQALSVLKPEIGRAHV